MGWYGSEYQTQLITIVKYSEVVMAYGNTVLEILGEEGKHKLNHCTKTIKYLSLLEWKHFEIFRHIHKYWEHSTERINHGFLWTMSHSHKNGFPEEIVASRHSHHGRNHC